MRLTPSHTWKSNNQAVSTPECKDEKIKANCCLFMFLTKTVPFSHVSVFDIKGTVHPNTVPFSHVSVFDIKGTVHPKMIILSSFTHPQVVPNLYECVCSEHKGRYSEE